MPKKVSSKTNQKTDNSYIEKDGGYEFTAWGIHVVADNLENAKANVLEYFGIDVDKDIPAPKIIDGEETLEDK